MSQQSANPTLRRSRFPFMLLLTVALGVLLALAALDWGATARAQDADNAIYLPHIAQFGSSSGTVEPSPSPSPSPSPTPEFHRMTFFTDKEWKTSSASMKVDAQAGIHLAYHYYEPRNGEAPTSAVYLYCARNCNDAKNWGEAKLLDGVNEVQLALTSTGKPRLLIRADRDNFDGDEYYYAECNQNCTTATGWKTEYVIRSSGTALWKLEDDRQPQRYFALDSQDRPRFLYADRNYSVEPDRYGTYYVYCDQNCTDGANWKDVLVGHHSENFYNYEMFEYPALVFGSKDQPRIVAAFNALGTEEIAVYYLACDSNCGEEDSWDRVRLWERGQGSNPGWDIALDSKDRPRIAYYPEALSDDSGRQLYYAWCNGSCLNAGSWQLANLDLGKGNGGDPDLLIDAQDRPHIAFVAYDGAGLGYATCDANCESAQAKWRAELLDDSNTLQTEWPVPIAPICLGGVWNALTPSLSLDAAGNLRLAYDVTYHANCWWHEDQWKSYYQFWLVQRSVRAILITEL